MTILQGTMQDGTVLPVQVNAQGQLIAEGLPGPAGPPGPMGEPGDPASATVGGFCAPIDFTYASSTGMLVYFDTTKALYRKGVTAFGSLAGVTPHVPPRVVVSTSGGYEIRLIGTARGSVMGNTSTGAVIVQAKRSGVVTQLTSVYAGWGSGTDFSGDADYAAVVALQAGDELFWEVWAPAITGGNNGQFSFSSSLLTVLYRAPYGI